MKIAIIGAGAAGLCAGRHCLENNFLIDIFEQTGLIGGTWNYTDEIGLDKNGLPIHTAMYEDLRINVPKELMMLDEIPHEEQKLSYVGSEVMLEYLKNYSRRFKIEPHIKFYTQVLKVYPQNNLWYIEFKNVKNQKIDQCLYDAVMVCNGHFKDTYIPIISGVETFLGNIIHSHDYRKRDFYKDRNVLLIGASFSGLDLAEQIVAVGKRVYLSHNSKIEKPISNEIVKKGVVVKIDRKKLHFDDGTIEEVDDIIFCTGYIYNFPFLSPECGVKVKNNWVHPLYKQLISIENPTLALIGLQFIACPFPIFGIQVRFFLATLTKHFQLPSKQEMLQELQKEIVSKSSIPLKKWHQLGELQGQYFDDLANTAKIKAVPPVIQKLYLHVRCNSDRELCFRIIDDDNFEQIR